MISRRQDLITLYLGTPSCPLDTVINFLNKLGMKLCINLVEISIFSQNRQTYQDYEQSSQTFQTFDFSKSFFSVKNWSNLSPPKQFFGEYWTWIPSFIKNFFWKFWFSKHFFFLKICPIFVGTLHNFGRSDNGSILWIIDYFY